MSAYTRLLEGQLAQTRKDLEHYRGKCERLELALLRKNDVVLPQTETRSITETKIEKPKRKTWKEVGSEWLKLKPEEQDKMIQGDVQ